MKMVVGMDLGLKGAYVALWGRGVHSYGRWDYRKKQSNGRRWSRFVNDVLEPVLNLLPSIVAYEATPIHRGKSYVQSFATLIEYKAWREAFECVPVHLSTIKAFAAKGGASKRMMRDALEKRHPDVFFGIDGDDDDVVDAAWAALWALEKTT